MSTIGRSSESGAASRPSILPQSNNSSANSSSNDLFRHRNKKKDDAIRKKVEQQLSSKTKRNSMGADRNRRSLRAGTVSSLRPAAAITVLESAKIVQAAQLMAAKRADAVLAVNEFGQLSGILTDKDIAYRVVAEGIDSRTTTVAQVMTRNPISVNDRGSRNEALNIMIQRHFRHLPVLRDEEDDDNDDASDGVASVGGGGTNVVGLLDITKCVFERLEDLERKVNEDANIVAAMEALERRGTVQSDHVDVIRAQHGCPDLASVLSRTNDDVPEVGVKASVRDAARAMKEFRQTAILVLNTGDIEERLSGIFTTKDIVLRVIAAGLDPATTSVVRVMTPHPDSVPASCTILDALKKLHVGHYLHLPVVDEHTHAILGLVDVLTLTMAMLEYLVSKDGGAEMPSPGADSGPMWNKFWNSTFAAGSTMETESEAFSMNDDSRSISSATAYQQHQQYMPSIPHPDHHIMNYQPSPPPARSPRSVTGTGGVRRDTANNNMLHDSASSVAAPQSTAYTHNSSHANEDPSKFGFKLRDPKSGKVYRFTSSSTILGELIAQIKSKPGLAPLGGEDDMKISYEDDEGDLVHLSSNADLEDAVLMARRAGWSKLSINIGADFDVASSVAGAGEISRKPATGGMHGGARAIGRQQRDDGIADFFRETPLVVNVGVSAIIVLATAYVVHRLQRW